MLKGIKLLIHRVPPALLEGSATWQLHDWLGSYSRGLQQAPKCRCRAADGEEQRSQGRGHQAMDALLSPVSSWSLLRLGQD